MGPTSPLSVGGGVFEFGFSFRSGYSLSGITRGMVPFA